MGTASEFKYVAAVRPLRGGGLHAALSLVLEAEIESLPLVFNPKPGHVRHARNFPGVAGVNGRGAGRGVKVDSLLLAPDS